MKKNPLILPSDEGFLEAFAMIVDINQFTLMIDSFKGYSMARFTCDALTGGVGMVQKHGGEVVGLMGDAFYALLPDVDSVIQCCIGIAIDINKQCEYFDHLREDPGDSEYPEGIGVKIAVEHGYLDVADIETNAMGRQRLFVGHAVIFASRISGAGRGNRCLVGPKAAEMIKEEGYDLKGPYEIKGKAGEPVYPYYQFDLGDIWLEGEVPPGGKWYVED